MKINKTGIMPKAGTILKTFAIILGCFVFFGAIAACTPNRRNRLRNDRFSIQIDPPNPVVVDPSIPLPLTAIMRNTHLGMEDLTVNWRIDSSLMGTLSDTTGQTIFFQSDGTPSAGFVTATAGGVSTTTQIVVLDPSATYTVQITSPTTNQMVYVGTTIDFVGQVLVNGIPDLSLVPTWHATAPGSTFSTRIGNTTTYTTPPWSATDNVTARFAYSGGGTGFSSAPIQVISFTPTRALLDAQGLGHGVSLLVWAEGDPIEFEQNAATGIDFTLTNNNGQGWSAIAFAFASPQNLTMYQTVSFSAQRVSGPNAPYFILFQNNDSGGAPVDKFWLGGAPSSAASPGNTAIPPNDFPLGSWRQFTFPFAAGSTGTALGARDNVSAGFVMVFSNTNAANGARIRIDNIFFSN